MYMFLCILNRIVVGEALYCLLMWFNCFRFQYPQSDRSGWSIAIVDCCITPWLCFSILNRIVVGEAALFWRTYKIRNLCFSILNRIVVGEAGRMSVFQIAQAAFQYPQSDRSGWSLEAKSVDMDCYNVSVSSIGS